MLTFYSCSFFSKDNARVWRVAEAIEVGMVGVNGYVCLTRLSTTQTDAYVSTEPVSLRLVRPSAV
jgi:acyl-CoA reductase-like NAD-dependent aldehyde dehydrogenase